VAADRIEYWFASRKEEPEDENDDDEMDGKQQKASDEKELDSLLQVIREYRPTKNNPFIVSIDIDYLREIYETDSSSRFASLHRSLFEDYTDQSAERLFQFKLGAQYRIVGSPMFATGVFFIFGDATVPGVPEDVVGRMGDAYSALDSGFG